MSVLREITDRTVQSPEWSREGRAKFRQRFGEKREGDRTIASSSSGGHEAGVDVSAADSLLTSAATGQPATVSDPVRNPRAHARRYTSRVRLNVKSPRGYKSRRDVDSLRGVNGVSPAGPLLNSALTAWPLTLRRLSADDRARPLSSALLLLGGWHRHDPVRIGRSSKRELGDTQCRLTPSNSPSSRSALRWKGKRGGGLRRKRERGGRLRLLYGLMVRPVEFLRLRHSLLSSSCSPCRPLLSRLLHLPCRLLRLCPSARFG